MKMNHGNGQLSLGKRDGRTGRVVFDSGSSYTYFPKEAYFDLVASVSSLIHSLVEKILNYFFTSSLLLLII